MSNIYFIKNEGSESWSWVGDNDKVGEYMGEGREVLDLETVHRLGFIDRHGKPPSMNNSRYEVFYSPDYVTRDGMDGLTRFEEKLKGGKKVYRFVCGSFVQQEILSKYGDSWERYSNGVELKARPKPPISISTIIQPIVNKLDSLVHKSIREMWGVTQYSTQIKYDELSPYLRLKFWTRILISLRCSLPKEVKVMVIQALKDIKGCRWTPSATNHKELVNETLLILSKMKVKKEVEES